MNFGQEILKDEKGNPVCINIGESDTGSPQLHVHFGMGRIMVSICRKDEDGPRTEIVFWMDGEEHPIGKIDKPAPGTTTDDLGPCVRLHFHNPEGARVVLNAIQRLIDDQERVIRERGGYL